MSYQTDWLNVGEKFTKGVEHEWDKIFDDVKWQIGKMNMGFSQEYAINAMIQEFCLPPLAVGEITCQDGQILAIRSSFKQGCVELFVHDDGHHTITPLAVRKYWQN